MTDIKVDAVAIHSAKPTQETR